MGHSGRRGAPGHSRLHTRLPGRVCAHVSVGGPHGLPGRSVARGRQGCMAGRDPRRHPGWAWSGAGDVPAGGHPGPQRQSPRGATRRHAEVPEPRHHDEAQQRVLHRHPARRGQHRAGPPFRRTYRERPPQRQPGTVFLGLAAVHPADRAQPAEGGGVRHPHLPFALLGLAGECTHQTARRPVARARGLVVGMEPLCLEPGPGGIGGGRLLGRRVGCRLRVDSGTGTRPAGRPPGGGAGARPDRGAVHRHLGQRAIHQSRPVPGAARLFPPAVPGRSRVFHGAVLRVPPGRRDHVVAVARLAHATHGGQVHGSPGAAGAGRGRARPRHVHNRGRDHAPGRPVLPGQGGGVRRLFP